MRPSTPHGLLPTPPPATLPTSLRHHCRLASLHHWRRTLPPPPVPTTASCPYRPRPSHPSRPRSHPAARRPPRCRRSPTRPTSATTAPSCVSRLTRSSAHSLPPSPPRCASSSATARRRLRRKYLPRARGVPPRVPLRPATYRPSLNTSGSSPPRWTPPPTSLVAASLSSASPPLAPVLRSRAEAGAPRTSPMGAASATTSRVPPTMARRLLSITPCPRLHAAKPPLRRYHPLCLRWHASTRPPARLRAPACTPPARPPPCRFTLLPLAHPASCPPRTAAPHT